MGNERIGWDKEHVITPYWRAIIISAGREF